MAELVSAVKDNMIELSRKATSFIGLKSVVGMGFVMLGIGCWIGMVVAYAIAATPDKTLASAAATGGAAAPAGGVGDVLDFVIGGLGGSALLLLGGFFIFFGLGVMGIDVAKGVRAGKLAESIPGVK